jgi:Zn-dependent M28 family amino/carboxypeptidase
VAVFNADMIGRSSPDSAALLGSVPPNLTSAALVEMGLAANAAVGGFALDSTWERAGHPENFFRRSDHWPYVQKGIPALYFTALLHEEYHTPFDESDKIHWGKLTRMTRWMYATGWAVANADQRPVFEGDLGLP